MHCSFCLGWIAAPMFLFACLHIPAFLGWFFFVDLCRRIMALYYKRG